MGRSAQVRFGREGVGRSKKQLIAQLGLAHVVLCSSARRKEILPASQRVARRARFNGKAINRASHSRRFLPRRRVSYHAPIGVA